MLEYVVLFIVLAFVFLFIDLIWLGIVAKSFYNKQIGFLLKDNVNWAAALIFYAIFVIGIMVFVALPAIDNDAPLQALGYGALFGFIAYSTYDLTNLATLKDWPLKITIVDLIWGSALGAFTAYFGVLIFMLIY